MLVLIKMYKDGINKDIVYIPKKSSYYAGEFHGDLRYAECDLLNTYTNKIQKGIILKDLLKRSLKENILGVINLTEDPDSHDDFVIIPIDYMTWKLMDYIYEFKTYHLDVIRFDFRIIMEDRFKYIEKEGTIFTDDKYVIHKYRTDKGNIYILCIYNLKMLDANGVL